MNERLEAVVSGRVQLVMYRDFAARLARRLGLVGEVQNLPDGTVRVIAEGSRATLEQFIMELKRGSLFSRVENVSSSWSVPRGGYSSFAIAYE